PRFLLRSGEAAPRYETTSRALQEVKDELLTGNSKQGPNFQVGLTALLMAKETRNQQILITM
ncbi:hypothetical protein NDU88_006861, partial [Pleurodeles waltl]